MGGVCWYCGNEAQNEENFAGNGLFYSWRVLPSRIYKDFFETQEWGKLANHPLRLIAYKPGTNNKIVLPIAQCQSPQDAKAAIMIIYRFFIDNPKYSKIKGNHTEQYYELKRLLKGKKTWPPVISGYDNCYNNPIFGDLNTLRMPYNRNIDDSNMHFEYDLIFIHGIDGDITQTWQSVGWDAGTFWPSNLLLSMTDGSLGNTLKNAFRQNGNEMEIPSISQMRILTVGHNFCVKAVETGMEEESFDDGCERIIVALNDAKVGRKPIIWLVHSLGGLIIKNILYKIKNDKKYQSNNELKHTLSIFNNTKGIIFYGTPHRGSCLAGAASQTALLNGKKTNVFVNTNCDSVGMQFMDPIKNQEKLNLLNDFLTDKTDIPFFNFIETKYVKGHVLVVPKDSAELVRKNEESNCKKEEFNLLVEEDHISICKFKNEKDGTYIKTKEILSAWILQSMKNVKKRNRNEGWAMVGEDEKMDEDWETFIKTSTQQVQSNLFIIQKYVEKQEYYEKKAKKIVVAHSASTAVALSASAAVATVEAGGSMAIGLIPSSMAVGASAVGLSAVLMPMVAGGLLGAALASRKSVADVIASTSASIVTAMSAVDGKKIVPRLKSSIETLNQSGILHTMSGEYRQKYDHIISGGNGDELIMFEKAIIEDMTAMCLVKEFESEKRGITSHNENKKWCAKYLNAANFVKLKINWNGNNGQNIATKEKIVVSIVDKMVRRDFGLIK